MTGPMPWSATPDQTTQLPDPPKEARPLDVVEVGRVPPSKWADAIDVAGQCTRIGAASSGRRLWRWLTVHKNAWKLADLKALGASAHDRYDEARKGQIMDLALHWLAATFVVMAVGAAGWVLLGAHGMWPLAIGSLWASLWYTAKGWTLVRLGRATLAEPSCFEPPLVRARRLDGTEDATQALYDLPGAEHEEGVRGFLRRVMPGRCDPAPEHAGAPERRVDPGRPAWLTQDTIEKRLRNAFKALRSLRPIEDDAPLIQLLDAEWTGNGWRFQVELPDEAPPASQFIDATEAVAKAWRVPPERILMTVGAAHPGILTVWVCDQDPLRTVVKWSNLLELDEVNLHEGWVLGEDLFGREIVYQPIASHCLTTGRSRSGKSVLQKLKLAYRLMDPHHQNIIIDPNGGEWRSYRDVAIYFGGPDAMGDALDYLRNLVEVEIPRRAGRLAELKELYPLRIPELKIPEWLARDASESLFALTVMIEEAPELFQGDDAQEWNDLLTRFSAQGLKYLMHLDLTFQRISNRAMGGKGVELRDLAGETAFCGSVRSESSARMALGDDYKTRGMNPLAILPRQHAGTFVATGAALVLPAGADHILIKSRFTDDAEGLQVRRKTLALRLRVRPALLPAHSRPASSAPERSGGPTLTKDPAPEPAAPLDLAPLRRVVEILAEHGGWVRASMVIGDLAARHPGEHGALTTLAELNELLGEFGLRARQHTLPDGTRPHQVHYPTCAARLQALEHPSESS